MKFIQTEHKAKLNILCSARVRLTEDQRKQLKTAYYEKRNAATPEPLAAIGGSSIRTETQFSVNSRLPLSDVVVVDLLNTRETITLTTILSLQAALGVEVITEKMFRDSFDGYVNYVMRIGNDDD
ncbi:hypothetical protein [Synechococcus sp. BIOS-E4-1]|uniref:hypothetical protein n=1 Tax=Synechococcus sp. BIOS-E4-1 TaxID=1400864 RepID=UPI001CA38E26|nr:hypothetical protein [Synechococcus sp. BIOS-E4-1]